MLVAYPCQGDTIAIDWELGGMENRIFLATPTWNRASNAELDGWSKL